MAAVHGIHTDIQSRHHSESVIERFREVWWTVYVLDCHLSSLMGVPLALAEQDISAQLPSFAGSSQKSLALSIHVRLAKTTTLILRSKHCIAPLLLCVANAVHHKLSTVKRVAWTASFWPASKMR